MDDTTSPSFLRYGRILERRFRRWRKRLRFLYCQRRISQAYASFDAAQVLKHCPRQPLYSIVVPVYRTERKWLRRCIQSVRRQLYPRWELILVDDGSKSQPVADVLRTYAAGDARIRPFYLPQNQGISAATNHGVAQARGQFVGFLDHDDELTPDALLWMAVAHNQNPRSKWFYSDEAVKEPDGYYVGRFHRKPAYSPEYLLSVMYTCHFSVYRRDLLELVGGLRSAFDGAQDHDLALRASEHVRRDEVTHIPQVLYFWRSIPQSTASGIEAKPKAADAAYRAVCEALQRRGIRGRVFADPDLRTNFRIELVPQSSPRVSILIPTRNRLDLLSRCVCSLISSTRYPNYEIVVIDNQSDERSLELFLQYLTACGRIRVFRYQKPFNHSDMHNQVVPSLDAELICLVNNDVYDFSQGWLEQLVATTQLDPSIAGAGGKLYYPDGTIQHAGLVVGIAGLAGNLWSGAPGDFPGYLGRARALQDMSAVTGAMMILRKAAFEKVGGFDADRYPTSYNDVDLWLRLAEAGYRCLYNPEAQAFHEEGKSRGVGLSEQELEYRERLREDLRKRNFVDPFWSLENLDGSKRRRLRESTSQWVLAKLEALQQAAQRLDRPGEVDKKEASQHAGPAGPLRRFAA